MCYLQPQINQSWQAATSRSDNHNRSLNLCVALSVGTQSISQISAAAGMPQTAHNQSVARNVAVVLPLELSISLTLTLFVYVARFTTVSLRSSLTQLVSMSYHNPSVYRARMPVDVWMSLCPSATCAVWNCGCRSVARTRRPV